jgi:hypothetical protein
MHVVTGQRPVPAAGLVSVWARVRVYREVPRGEADRQTRRGSLFRLEPYRIVRLTWAGIAVGWAEAFPATGNRRAAGGRGRRSAGNRNALSDKRLYGKWLMTPPGSSFCF